MQLISCQIFLPIARQNIVCWWFGHFHWHVHKLFRLCTHYCYQLNNAKLLFELFFNYTEQKQSSNHSVKFTTNHFVSVSENKCRARNVISPYKWVNQSVKINFPHRKLFHLVLRFSASRVVSKLFFKSFSTWWFWRYTDSNWDSFL